jgi:hypothetical protein
MRKFDGAFVLLRGGHSREPLASYLAATLPAAPAGCGSRTSGYEEDPASRSPDGTG